MRWLEGALWGAFGGFAMEALDYIIAVRRWRRLPWNVDASSLRDDRQPLPAPDDRPGGGLPAPGFLAYAIAGLLRAAVGCGVAAAVTRTSPMAMSAWLAVMIGATAPMVLEKITMFVPLVVHVGKEGIAATVQQAQRPDAGPPPVNGVPSAKATTGQAVPLGDGTGAAPHNPHAPHAPQAPHEGGV
ncbi:MULTISPECIES: hypothetical protein [Streptomyces]|uniref:hypothetical protein n=1 Tax=Streptomyces TaxID=1883 RepID=UPI00163CB858|nr:MULTISPECIES: hypothetical protein [Streptomyces]MBC2877240.1 hypothetical protein [Streptomyces sp. TYQ1024]UBI39506.1 hypothetical protein K7I03_25565 [Streptomyces mobaraensis]UKW32085.1 hypothetical protein MCU78_25500 [Streptomyces sp. TYQ1024]